MEKFLGIVCLICFAWLCISIIRLTVLEQKDRKKIVHFTKKVTEIIVMYNYFEGNNDERKYYFSGDRVWEKSIIYNGEEYSGPQAALNVIEAEISNAFKMYGRIHEYVRANRFDLKEKYLSTLDISDKISLITRMY